MYMAIMLRFLNTEIIASFRIAFHKIRTLASCSVRARCLVAEYSCAWALCHVLLPHTQAVNCYYSQTEALRARQSNITRVVLWKARIWAERWVRAGAPLLRSRRACCWQRREDSGTAAQGLHTFVVPGFGYNVRLRSTTFITHTIYL